MIAKHTLYPLILLLLFLSLPANPTAAAMLIPHGQATSLLPFLDYHIEDAAPMDIEEIAVLGQTNAFQPFDKAELPLSEGVLWLRFTLAPLQPDLQAGTYLLDMGSGIPGEPVLYVPTRSELSGALEWRENTPSQRDILLMPEQGRNPITCYIRIDGLPGPWFNPVIRSPQNAATNWSSLFHTGASLALGIVMLLCLLRGLNENGQWRIWTGLFVFFALIQNILGIPPYGQGFSFAQAASAMTPGLALMTLPHAARHFLKTGSHSKSLDYQLLFLSILGGCLAIAPLVPGLGWLDRWLELWPLLIALFIPTALGIWMSGLRGSRAFLLACIIPPLFTITAWLGIDFGFPLAILASLPAWGIALCGLLLIAMPVNSTTPNADKKARETGSLELKSDDPGIIDLEHPLNDPNLRLHTGAPEPLLSAQPSTPAINLPKALNSREGAMRRELDVLLRETSGLGQCALPPASRLYAESIIKSANTLASIVTDPDYHEEREENEEPLRESFNLQSVVRSVHDAAAPIAEHAGLSLSWYMPPYLGQDYAGDADQLAHILSLLVDSAIRGTTRGNIKLSVRRVPESQDPGHLLFTVSDTGDGAPPLRRSSVALAKAWEFASRHGGFLGMESGPGGLSIAFTAHLSAKENEKAPEKRRINVIVTGNSKEIRGKLANYVEEIPYNVMEAASIEEALKRQQSEPVNLLVATGNEARPAIGDIISEFSKIGKNAGYKAVYILAITPDESQWSLLKASGFTHAMTEPVDRDSFKITVSQLVLPPPPESGAGATETQAPTPEKAPQDNIIDLMDTFYSASSDLISGKTPLSPPEAPAGEKIEAPQMLDEQEFDLSQTFEGPEWLESPQERNSEEGQAASPEKSAESDARDGENSSPPPPLQEEPALAEPQKSQEGEQPRQLTDVWISEPMPISQPQKDASRAAAKHAPQEQKNEAQIASPASPQGQNPSMMDLIVSVNATPAEEKKPDPTPPSVVEASPASEQQASALEALLSQLDDGLAQAQKAYAGRDCAMVEEATAGMARAAEDYGYRIVGRLARCVERAARAKDLPALGDLLPVLADAVERNRIATSPRK